MTWVYTAGLGSTITQGAHAGGGRPAAPWQGRHRAHRADIGYESEAAFARAFKRVTGMTPGRWRDGGADSRALMPLQFKEQIPGRLTPPYLL